jgi:osmotically inducible protein OsmC
MKMDSLERRKPVAIARRRAETVWTGSLAAGDGVLSSQSGAIAGLPVTWASRTEDPGGKTSPEELAAAAHSSCFSMALALRLAAHGHAAERLVVACVVTLDEVDGVPTVTSSELDVRGRVPALDAEGFEKIAEEAADICPISRLFAGARVTVHAEFEA